jgi:hypothetical protein
MQHNDTAGKFALLTRQELAPIHKPITGLHPWNRPLGKGPALASLGGHALYGLMLGSVF